ncbi:MAG: cytochrome c [Burkholderiales bacterium]
MNSPRNTWHHYLEIRMKAWKEIVVATLGMALLASAGFAWSQRIRDLPPASQGIKMPAFSPMALAGQLAYDATCAKCHGAYGAGTDKGPPFLNPVYNPGHHPDEAFMRAVRNGVRQHHWNFGDMPAQPAVSEEEVRQIIRYVREVQQANGIVFEAHRM